MLTWGSEPEDLDAHLTGPNASDDGRFHVYWPNGSRGSTDVAPFSKLDLDDTSGAGPETITIGQLNSGVYRYSVHDFTNAHKAASTALGSSGAKGELYAYAQQKLCMRLNQKTTKDKKPFNIFEIDLDRNF